MNEIIVPETGLPLRFPDPREEAYARAQEFRRLSPGERWEQIVSLAVVGLNMVRTSPRRKFIEQRWDAQEREWQKIQQSIFEQYGK